MSKKDIGKKKTDISPAGEELEILAEEEILLRAQNQDNQAIEYLMKKYKGVVRRKARTLFIIGGDQDDLMQEGMIGLFKAIKDYRAGRDTSFSTFADLCIARQMYSAIKSSNRQKNLPLNTYVSLYAPAYSENEETEEGNFMVDVNSLGVLEQSPEEILINKESVESAKDSLMKKLSKMEKAVMELYFQGMTYQEIAAAMKKSPKAIDNALQRIKNKVNK